MKTDEGLRRDILEEFDWDAGVDASHIGVVANKGVVTLSGHVLTHSDKHAAEDVTKRVRGVKAIANEIEVRPSDSHQREDEHIAMAAVHALEWNVKVPSDQIQVVVGDGWITLDGSTAHRFEKSAAERAVRHLIGIRGVTNNILLDHKKASVAEQEQFGQIEGEIESALRRSAIVDSTQISVDVNEKVVILSGDVRSHAERDEVERIAWMPRGISQVENCITITPWGCGPIEEWGY